MTFRNSSLFVGNLKHAPSKLLDEKLASLVARAEIECDNLRMRDPFFGFCFFSLSLFLCVFIFGQRIESRVYSARRLAFHCVIRDSCSFWNCFVSFVNEQMCVRAGGLVERRENTDKRFLGSSKLERVDSLEETRANTRKLTF